MSGPVKKIAVRPTSRAGVLHGRHPARPRAPAEPPALFLESTANGSSSHHAPTLHDREQPPRRAVCSATSPRFFPGRSPPRVRAEWASPSEPPSTASPPQRESTLRPNPYVPVRKTLDSRSHPVPPPSLHQQEPAQHGEGPARRARQDLRRQVPHQGLEAQVRARPSRRRVLDHGR